MKAGTKIGSGVHVVAALRRPTWWVYSCARLWQRGLFAAPDLHFTDLKGSISIHTQCHPSLVKALRAGQRSPLCGCALKRRRTRGKTPAGPLPQAMAAPAARSDAVHQTCEEADPQIEPRTVSLRMQSTTPSFEPLNRHAALASCASLLDHTHLFKRPLGSRAAAAGAIS